MIRGSYRVHLGLIRAAGVYRGLIRGSSESNGLYGVHTDFIRGSAKSNG